MIPLKYTGFGEGISPDLMVTEVPDGTISYAVIMDDLDVPFRNSFTHWIIWNITRTDVIPEVLPKGGHITDPIDACREHHANLKRQRPVKCERKNYKDILMTVFKQSK